MKLPLKLKLSHFSILFATIIVIWVSSNYNWGDKRWEGILKSDATGYYAYLPAIFIYNDLNFSFLDTIISSKKYSENLNFDFRENHKGIKINKFFCGVALLQLPFFGMSHGISATVSTNTDGYSSYYMIFVQLATIFYLIIGLYFLRKLLKTYHISEKNISISLTTIIFGTNLFHYTVSEPGMSHVYSFSMISMFLFFQRQFFSNRKVRYWYYSMIILGIIVLIRPVNAIVVFSIPFISGTSFNLKHGILVFRKQPGSLILSIAIFLLIICIQLIIYKIQTGDFLVYSYKEEGFNFLALQLSDFLFSYRKGMYIYTPVLLLITFFGLIKLTGKDPYLAVTWLLYFLVTTYILSSWHLWYYGGSFSSRVMIEFYSLFAIPLAIFLNGLKSKKLQIIFITVLFALIVLCQIQTYQYRTGRIHWSEMDKEMYWQSVKKIVEIF